MSLKERFRLRKQTSPEQQSKKTPIHHYIYDPGKELQEENPNLQHGQILENGTLYRQGQSAKTVTPEQNTRNSK